MAKSNEADRAPVHISVVLDRSGSMATIADDIVGGFNEFLDRQRALEGDARVTLVQFDSQDPFELLIDGVHLREVTNLERSTYRPRGTTPLYDAVGRMIGRVDAEIARRSDLALLSEDQVVVIITDGLENASLEHTRSSVYELIGQRRERGWVFVFLGADQDAYAEGGAIGVPAPNAANWEKTPDGTREVWRAVAASTAAYREKPRAQRRADRDRFLQGRRDKSRL